MLCSTITSVSFTAITEEEPFHDMHMHMPIYIYIDIYIYVCINMCMYKSEAYDCDMNVDTWMKLTYASTPIRPHLPF